MPHDWKCYEAAQKITCQLHESGLIKTWSVDKVRGIIQIYLEDKFIFEKEIPK